MTTTADRIREIAREYGRAFETVSEADYYRLMEKLRNLADSMTVPEDVEDQCALLNALAGDLTEMNTPNSIDAAQTCSDAATALEALSARVRELDGELIGAKDQEEFSRNQADSYVVAYNETATAHNELVAELEKAEAQRNTLAAENARLREGIGAVETLINESSGVVGLHLNGDFASWGDLRTGGRYEEWLLPFDATLQERG